MQKVSIFLNLPEMTDREFSKFSKLIQDCCGIKLTPVKKIMLSGRLSKRLRKLRITSFSRYYEYLQSSRGKNEELTQLLDAVTTNKTEFFREPRHFTLLIQKILPELIRKRTRFGCNKLNIWSAGCSSGEEPYTLSMILSDFMNSNPGPAFSILATDISTRMLSNAVNAIYSEDTIKSIPMKFRQQYLLRGIGTRTGYYRVVPEIRRCVTFRRLNFLDTNFGIHNQMDIIFCRNVIIYFDRCMQKLLIDRFYDQLMPDGYLLLGHSESLHGIDSRFYPVEPTIYKKT